MRDAELAALNAEADMPIEELLAAYQAMRDDEDASEEGEADLAPSDQLNFLAGDLTLSAFSTESPSSCDFYKRHMLPKRCEKLRGQQSS